MKRTLSILLALLMLVSLVPFHALAENVENAEGKEVERKAQRKAIQKARRKEKKKKIRKTEKFLLK